MEYLSVKEAAARLGVHPSTIRRAIDSGRLPAYYVSHVLRILAADLDRIVVRKDPAA